MTFILIFLIVSLPRKHVRQIRALERYLGGYPHWVGIWETVNGRDRLVFLSRELISEYKRLSYLPPRPEHTLHEDIDC